MSDFDPSDNTFWIRAWKPSLHVLICIWCILNLFYSDGFSQAVDRISMGLSILYFMGSPVEMSVSWYNFLHILHVHSTFHLDMHYSAKYLFADIQSEKGFIPLTYTGTSSYQDWSYQENQAPDKSVYWSSIFFIYHPKHMLWVLKRTVSIRRFFEHPKHKLKLIGKYK